MASREPASSDHGLGVPDFGMPGAHQAATGPMAQVWAWIVDAPRTALVLLCLALFLPGLFSLPPLDRDESRFAQASKQMLESGDFVNIRFLDGARNKKPAGIHWMQAAVASLAGGPEKAGIWAYRMPSVIGAILAVLLLHWAACRLFDPQTALLAAAFLAASVSLVAETTISKTDGMLLASIVAMNAVLARNYMLARQTGGRRAAPADPLPFSLAALFWTAMAASLLLKGPIGPMVIGLTVAALVAVDRDAAWLRGLRPGLGLLWTALLVLPWGIAIFISTGGTYYEEAIGKDLAAKVVSAQESHGAPPGFYLALVTLTFFPGSLFLWPALWRTWIQRGQPAFRFCLAWIIPTWIVFECFPTKLPHYSMPTYPALALVTGAVVLSAIRGETRILSGPVGRISLGLWMLFGLALAAAVSILPQVFADGPGLAAMALTGLGAGLVLAVAVLGSRRDWARAAGLAVLSAVVIYGALLEGTLPRLERLGVSPRLEAVLVEAFGSDRDRWPRLSSAGYHEPSLVFLTRSDTLLQTGVETAAHLATSSNHVALVESREQEAFKAALDTAPPSWGTPVVLGVVEGYNYSNGRTVTVTVYGAPSRRTRPPS